MRQQIAAANWKMNLTYQQGEELLDAILPATAGLNEHQRAIFAVPAPYLQMAVKKTDDYAKAFVAAQNFHDKKAGAYTGEISADMLHSIHVTYVVLGHSERREYFGESNAFLAAKVTTAIQEYITPIFCCGEPLPVREQGNQNEFVRVQLEESLFHLSAEQMERVVIAYEPIWAIGTGVTASTAQAQEMHAYIRSVLADKYGAATAEKVSILYGGSVKAANAAELFACPDVDGGLVGGASLVAEEFKVIIGALK
ncbi:triose-phosphate isomerase [Parasegetibacter sp. NRK P23]|uniref:triose-phosphate isomerase n=1 Tax=Parasegetibacter sp. NRK P23 TaxID=2942999 RepID=UPI0020444F37|nr:triose-phosphate isomerase [Parasegetibacter sp. NRK P23]MCM5530657.1 triose-phosphate isomerase [Parasegetibacter sp. NRK P23]